MVTGPLSQTHYISPGASVRGETAGGGSYVETRTGNDVVRREFSSGGQSTLTTSVNVQTGAGQVLSATSYTAEGKIATQQYPAAGGTVVRDYSKGITTAFGSSMTKVSADTGGTLATFNREGMVTSARNAGGQLQTFASPLSVSAAEAVLNQSASKSVSVAPSVFSGSTNAGFENMSFTEKYSITNRTKTNLEMGIGLPTNIFPAPIVDKSMELSVNATYSNIMSNASKSERLLFGAGTLAFSKRENPIINIGGKVLSTAVTLGELGNKFNAGMVTGKIIVGALRGKGTETALNIYSTVGGKGIELGGQVSELLSKKTYTAAYEKGLKESIQVSIEHPEYALFKKNNVNVLTGEVVKPSFLKTAGYVATTPSGTAIISYGLGGALGSIAPAWSLRALETGKGAISSQLITGIAGGVVAFKYGTSSKEEFGKWAFQTGLNVAAGQAGFKTAYARVVNSPAYQTKYNEIMQDLMRKRLVEEKISPSSGAGREDFRLPKGKGSIGSLTKETTTKYSFNTNLGKYEIDMESNALLKVTKTGGKDKILLASGTGKVRGTVSLAGREVSQFEIPQESITIGTRVYGTATLKENLDLATSGLNLPETRAFDLSKLTYGKSALKISGTLKLGGKSYPFTQSGIGYNIYEETLPNIRQTLASVRTDYGSAMLGAKTEYGTLNVRTAFTTTLTNTGGKELSIIKDISSSTGSKLLAQGTLAVKTPSMTYGEQGVQAYNLYDVTKTTPSKGLGNMFANIANAFKTRGEVVTSGGLNLNQFINLGKESGGLAVSSGAHKIIGSSAFETAKLVGGLSGADIGIAKTVLSSAVFAGVKDVGMAVGSSGTLLGSMLISSRTAGPTSYKPSFLESNIGVGSQSMILKSQSKEGYSSLSGMLPTSRVEVAQISGLETLQLPRLGQALRIEQAQLVKVGQVQIQGLEQLSGVDSIIGSPSGGTTNFIPPPPPVIPPFWAHSDFSFGLMEGMGGGKVRKNVGKKHIYVPSVQALVFNIRGKKPGEYLVRSGLGLRPMVR